MYDGEKKDGIEPQIEFALMRDWVVGTAPAAAGQVLILQSRMLRYIPRALGPNVAVTPGTRIRTDAMIMRIEGARRARERRLGCILPFGVETVPLYELDSAAALGLCAKRMKDMWAKGLGDRG